MHPPTLSIAPYGLRSISTKTNPMTADRPRTTYRLGYRPDVEGLRAVAILLVVAAHANVAWLAGGYVGVDVFYVLSGYLITGLLVQEATTNGRIRFAVFYGRRLRRLLPTLLLMLAVTCGLALLLMPPSELAAQAASASSAVLWLSNFHFATWNVGYFAPAAKTNLFLHTWSLGVEEQFYLVWPLLVMLATGAFKRSPFALGTARLKWLFGGIFVGSFALCLLLTWRAPQFAFYMMPTRAWQFALGALVFLAAGSPEFRPTSGLPRFHWLRHLGWTGLAMILFTAIWINDNVPYPGTWALLPTFGAALVLAAGGGGACCNTRRWQAAFLAAAAGARQGFLCVVPVALAGVVAWRHRAGCRKPVEPFAAGRIVAGHRRTFVLLLRNAHSPPAQTAGASAAGGDRVAMHNGVVRCGRSALAACSSRLCDRRCLHATCLGTRRLTPPRQTWLCRIARHYIRKDLCVW